MNLLPSDSTCAEEQACSWKRSRSLDRWSRVPKFLGISFLFFSVWLVAVPAVHGFSGVKISPDGRHVVWESNSEIFVMDLAHASAQPQKISRGHDAIWSPDSRRLAFIATGANKRQPQLYVVGAAGGRPTRVTNLTGTLTDPQWSPDGKSLSFLLVENAPRKPGPTEVVKLPTGVVGKHGFAQRLAVVKLASGSLHVISPRDLYVYQYAWSPDSNKVVATAAQPPGDDNWYSAKLYVFNIGSGEAKCILKPGMQIGVPRWSPDGEKIAFIGGLMSGLEGLNGDVYIMSPGGGGAHDLTPQMKASARTLFWLSPNRLLFTEFVHGQRGLAEVDTSNGKISQLWKSKEFSSEGGSFSNFSIAGNGKTSALILQAFDRPPEIWAGRTGAWKQITHFNKDLHPTWGKVKSVEWRSDNWNIQGWLYYPRDYDPDVRYPMVVIVHGGPAWLNSPGWDGEYGALSKSGYFVFLPNPRGSAGEGEAFERANVKDIGHGDLRDILAGVNKLVETLPIDKNRIGIFGWSYGGYMSMWAPTQTHLFHAAVAGAGIADWLSYASQNVIPKWVIPYFGASVYIDPSIYARSSPINYIKNVKTPTLILVGAGDGECPPPQSLEFWDALRTLGVKTKLVIYPDEGHAIRKPEDWRDINHRMTEWFNKYLK